MDRQVVDGVGGESAEAMDQKLVEAIKNAQAFSLIPILQLIKHVTGVDYGNKVGIDMSATPGSISLQSSDGKKVNVGLSVVGDSYNIMESFNDSGIYNKSVETFLELEDPIKEQVIELVSFLLKCALLAFIRLKDTDLRMEIAEHQLDMDNNTRLYILSEGGDKKMISVVFTVE